MTLCFSHRRGAAWRALHRTRRTNASAPVTGAIVQRPLPNRFWSIDRPPFCTTQVQRSEPCTTGQEVQGGCASSSTCEGEGKGTRGRGARDCRTRRRGRREADAVGDRHPTTQVTRCRLDKRHQPGFPVPCPIDKWTNAQHTQQIHTATSWGNAWPLNHARDLSTCC